MKPSKLFLKENPTLKQYQVYVQEMMEERGFDGANVTGQFLQFTEEVGELAKAIRKKQNMKVDANSKVEHVEEEVADIFMYLLYFCNYFKVDLEQAFREKEEKNKQRVWAAS